MSLIAEIDTDSVESSLHPSSSRTAHRLRMGLAAALIIALAAVAIDLFYRLGRLPEATLATRVLAAIAMAVAGVCVLVALRDRRLRSMRGRRGRLLLLSIGILILFEGQALTYLIASVTPGPFQPAIEALPLALATPFLAFALARFSWPRGVTGRDILYISVDGVLAALALALLWAQLVHTHQPQVTDGLDRAAQDIDPWSQYVLVLAVIVMASTARRVGALPIVQLVLLQSAVLLYVASDVAGDIKEGADSQSLITWSIVGYVVAAALLVAFAIRPPIEVDPPGAGHTRDLWSLLVPGSPIAVAVVVLLIEYQEHGGFSTGVIALATLTALWAATATFILRLTLVQDLRSADRLRASAQLAVSTNSEWYSALVGDSRDLVTVVDREGQIVYQTPSVQPVLGFEPSALVHTPLSALIPDDGHTVLSRLLIRVARDPSDRGPHDLTLLDSRGARHQTETTVARLRLGGWEGFVLTTRDVTDRRLLRAELDASASRDGLTGLPSRIGLLERLHDILPATHPGTAAVALLDLNAFRVINDRFGYQCGDRTLQQVAEVIQSLPGSVAAVARLRGDEYALVVTSDTIEQELGRVLRILQEGLAGVRVGDAHDPQLTFTLGYALNDPADLTGGQLLERAELALSHARRVHSTSPERFEESMQAQWARQRFVEEQLRAALAEDRLEVVLQPIVDLADEGLRGVEALSRLTGEDGKPIAPPEFIEVAEQSDLILQVGEYVLRRSAAAATSLPAGDQDPPFVAVNISARQLTNELPELVRSVLADSGLPSSRLVLELTETAFATRPDTPELVQELRDLGCRVALDDFGTGYSSLAYLAHLPVDELKIDKSFIDTIGTTKTSSAVVRAMLQIARSLGMETVAEGVESPAQARMLRQLRCDYAQGYLYSKPLPPADLIALLERTGGVLSPRP